MTGRTRTTLAVFGGAALVASAAYAVGSQAGGGNAEAAKTRAAAQMTAGYGYGPGPAGFRGNRPDPFAGLASKLGVSAAKLRTALQALRTDESKDDHEAELAAALAKALGKSEADVKDALAKLRQAHEDEHARREAALYAAVAKALGKSTADVKAAFEKNRPADPGPGDRDGRHGPGPFGGPGGPGGPRGHRFGGPGAPAALSAIAKDLGVSTAKLRAALMTARPQDPPKREERGDRGADLAKALGVTTDELEEAFDEVRTAERDAFAEKLAANLGIDAQKVKDALADGFPFFHGPGGGRRHR